MSFTDPFRLAAAVPADARPYVAPAHRLADDPDACARWRAVFAGHRAMLADLGNRVDPSYVAGLRWLDLDPFAVPTLRQINRRLRPLDWVAVSVDGYIPTRVYGSLLAHRIFPVANFLRGAEHLEHSPSPDLVHDVLGHLPMLVDREHRDFLVRIGSVFEAAHGNEHGDRLYRANRHLSLLMVRGAPADEIALAERQATAAAIAASANPSQQTELERMFLWSVEFGLVGTPDDYKLLGAGILSSVREARRACQRTAVVVPYSGDVVDHDIDFTGFQSRYFVARGYRELEAVLAAYEAGRGLGLRHAS